MMRRILRHLFVIPAKAGAVDDQRSIHLLRSRLAPHRGCAHPKRSELDSRVGLRRPSGRGNDVKRGGELVAVLLLLLTPITALHAGDREAAKAALTRGLAALDQGD